MNETRLNVSVDGPVARLTLARPDKHNAFDKALITELSETLARVGGDAAIRVVVLAAQGESFSAGADLEWMRRAASYDEARNLEDAHALARLMHALDTLPKRRSRGCTARRSAVGSDWSPAAISPSPARQWTSRCRKCGWA